MANVDELCADLLAERTETLELVAPLHERSWRTPTPAPGWTILDQVTHLAFFDEAARQSIADPDGFRAHRKAAVGDMVEAARAAHEHRRGTDAADWLRRAGDELAAVARAADPLLRTPWYGPDMSIASTITARIMETWAHTQDIADALGVTRAPSGRLAHVAFIGCRALPNAFRAQCRPVPDVPVRVELDDWSFGPDDASNVVRGSLQDFCLVVTQRRHLADTGLVATGDVAREWLTIAQAFAGPPGAGRQPGQFA